MSYKLITELSSDESWIITWFSSTKESIKSPLGKPCPACWLPTIILSTLRRKFSAQKSFDMEIKEAQSETMMIGWWRWQFHFALIEMQKNTQFPFSTFLHCLDFYLFILYFIRRVAEFSEEARNSNLWFNTNLKLLKQTDCRRQERQEPEWNHLFKEPAEVPGAQSWTKLKKRSKKEYWSFHR